MKKEVIDIIIPCSDKYLSFVSVLMLSAVENLDNKYRLFFHIITEDISSDSILKNNLLKKDFDFDVEYIYISDANLFHLPFCVCKHIDSKIVYAKLIISSLFPKLDKAIILEGDMIVTGDLSELWNINLENYSIAAVKDAWYKLRENYITKPYFNTGMFYANLAKWREFDFEKKILEIIPNMELDFPDQDIFNKLFNDSVLFLDWCWNVPTCVFEQWFTALEENEKQKIKANHKILHFIYKIKPWQNVTSYYNEYFWFYARKSPFYEVMLKQMICPNNYLIGQERDYLLDVLNYRKNVFQYLRYKFLFFVTVGNKKEHYKQKQYKIKQKIKVAKDFLSNKL